MQLSPLIAEAGAGGRMSRGRKRLFQRPAKQILSGRQRQRLVLLDAQSRLGIINEGVLLIPPSAQASFSLTMRFNAVRIEHIQEKLREPNTAALKEESDTQLSQWLKAAVTAAASKPV